MCSYECGRVRPYNYEPASRVVVFSSGLMVVEFTYIRQGYFTDNGSLCQWNSPVEYDLINHIIPTITDNSITAKQTQQRKTVCIFYGLYCMCVAYLKYDDVMTCIRFLRYWPFSGGNLLATSRFPSQRASQQNGLRCFLWCWTSSRVFEDFRRHYVVIVMW